MLRFCLFCSCISFAFLNDLTSSFRLSVRQPELRKLAFHSILFADRKNSLRRDSYESSSYVVKFVVGSLTEILKTFGFGKDEQELDFARFISNKNVDAESLRSSIIADFDRGYLFTGCIDFDIYDRNCVFTDPTISFKGLSTFKRNIDAVRPLLDTFLLERNVTLFSCDLVVENESAGRVIATWRMAGSVKVFWNPCIDLTGQTTFTYRVYDGGCFVVDYFEEWDLSSVEALLQLITPKFKYSLSESL